MKRVVIESPFAGVSPEDRKENIIYMRAAIRDSFLRGEAPFASHAIYTQHGILNDDDPDERELGIEAGLVWGSSASLTAVYVDRGISTGMRQGIVRAYKDGRDVIARAIQIPSADAHAVAELHAKLLRTCVCGHDENDHEEACGSIGSILFCPCSGFTRLFRIELGFALGLTGKA